MEINLVNNIIIKKKEKNLHKNKCLLRRIHKMELKQTSQLGNHKTQILKQQIEFD